MQLGTRAVEGNRAPVREATALRIPAFPFATAGRPFRRCAVRWLQTLDLAVFRAVNGVPGGPVLDWVMERFSDKRVLFAVLIPVAIWLWRCGGKRGRVSLVMLALVAAAGDPYVCTPLKRALDRPRPHVTLSDTVVRGGRTGSPSFPSAHAFNWGVILAAVAWYYRRML